MEYDNHSIDELIKNIENANRELRYMIDPLIKLKSKLSSCPQKIIYYPDTGKSLWIFDPEIQGMLDYIDIQIDECIGFIRKKYSLSDCNSPINKS